MTQALETRSLPTPQLQKFEVLGKFIVFDGNLVINDSVTAPMNMHMLDVKLHRNDSAPMKAKSNI